MSAFDKKNTPPRRTWTPPSLQAVGTVGDVLRGGGGKNSPSPADPGEVRKPKGQANE